MSEIGSISVSINGDASGLMNAVNAAQASVASLQTAVAGLKSQNVSVNIAAIDNASKVVDAATAQINAFGNLKSNAELSALDNTGPGVASAKAAINSIQDKTVTVTVKVKQEGSAAGFASGTNSAPGGLALVNDEKGIPDPRELIYHRGNYYLFEGRDILIPLDKGDKVFTASQTKNMMKSGFIPSYASGKNNELFEMDKRIFKNKTKTSNISLEEQIDWWKYALETYWYDSEAVMECSEEIFSLTRKLVDEINQVSEIYVEERNLLNNWSEFGDSEIEAFERIRNRNKEFLDSGIITWEEYCETIDRIGSDMYEQRIEYSENWLKQQYKYNNMSVEDYIKGLDRMAAYTKEYFENGLIDDAGFFYGMQSISNQKSDMEKVLAENEYKAWQKSSSGWKKQRETYGDWDEYGDSLIQFYQRCIERQEEFFSQGKIDWETYNDAVINYRMELYKAEQDEAERLYDDFLSRTEEYISNMENEFKKVRDNMDYEYELKKLDSEFLKASQTKAIYKNAVTQKGKDVYEEAVEKAGQIGYEREALILEKEQTAKIEALESQYKLIEDNKSLIMDKIVQNGFDVSGTVESVLAEVSQGQGNVCYLLNELIAAVKNSQPGTVYGNTTYNITGADAAFVGPILQRSAAALAYGYGG